MIWKSLNPKSEGTQDPRMKHELRWRMNVSSMIYNLLTKIDGGRKLERKNGMLYADVPQ